MGYCRIWRIKETKNSVRFRVKEGKLQVQCVVHTCLYQEPYLFLSLDFDTYVKADCSWHGRLVSSFFQVIPHIHLTWQRSYLGTENVMMRDVIDRTFFLNGSTAPSGPGPPHPGFTITFKHNALGRIPVDEWSARRTELYLTTHNTHNRQTTMRSAGFELTIPGSERLQILVLDRAGTGVSRQETQLTIYI